MSIDGGLRTLFRSNLSVGWHWQSIETGGTGLGVPDSNFCRLPGVEGWIEYKLTDAWAVDLRTEQIGWLRERSMRGGRCFVAVRRKNEGGPRRGAPVDELYVYRGSSASILAREGLRGGAKPLYIGVGGPSGWDWGRVAETLCG